MFNPPNPYPNPNSYDDVLKKMTQRLRENGLDERILGILQQAFEQELDTGQIVLSRPERKSLFQQIVQTILTDALGKIGGKPQ